MEVGAVPERWRVCLGVIAQELAERAIHPARAVVLLPYAQLMPLAAAYWARLHPDGFMPHFETTTNWAQRVGCFVPRDTDVHPDQGANLMIAAELLDQVGQGALRDALAPQLMQETLALRQIAAAQAPAQRADWAALARAALALPARSELALDAVLHATAVAWAGGSDYATDVLFAEAALSAVDWLFIVPGLERDPLTDALAERCAGHVTRCALAVAPPAARIAVHACETALEHAERAAAVILKYRNTGIRPVALVAIDRELTRRIAAILSTQGVRAGAELRDETGWRLSTTHAAASVLAALRAAQPDASTDDVLDWVKLAPVFAASSHAALERQLRRAAIRWWRDVRPEEDEIVATINAHRPSTAQPHTLCTWLLFTHTLLETSELWDVLAHDAAGMALIQTLSLDTAGLERWRAYGFARRTLDSAAFLRWVQATLEGATFQPPKPVSADVVVLPLSQLFGRDFAAIVVPGADADQLPAVPAATGPSWSEHQRVTLGLPTRTERADTQRHAWQQALAGARVDILWSRQSATGEPRQPSPLVELLRVQRPGAYVEGGDARTRRTVAARPTQRPRPSGTGLPMEPLSATSYERMRACPYRFFALTQLGLQAQDELDADLEKRDWGNWVHRTLRYFQEALCEAPEADREALMDAAADHATHELGVPLESGEFLPFHAAWPPLRARYLDWLRRHEAAGNVFQAAEKAVKTTVDGVHLKGRFDRVDRDADGHAVVMDYKTEGLQKTNDRIKAGTEDTQLPFYALLADEQGTRAAYLNLAEREDKGPTWRERTDLADYADLLRTGMAHDLRRVAAGAPLRALGEGSVCDFCEVRGLCRKDFWSGEDGGEAVEASDAGAARGPRHE